MESDAKGKPYDLEERTFEFARRVRGFVKILPRTLCNREDAKQLMDASGSVGANYIEANESLGRKDFAYRIKICRKEAKESHYWLRLLYTVPDSPADKERKSSVEEARELVRIFSSISVKLAQKQLETQCLRFGAWNLFGIWSLEFGIWSLRDGVESP